MFARMRLRPDSKEYREYYAKHPQRQTLDNQLRAAPGLLHPKSQTYNEEQALMIRAAFRSVADLGALPDVKPAPDVSSQEPAVLAALLKKAALSAGAALVGITAASPTDYYSHRGFNSDGGAQRITTHHHWAVVFAVEMPWQQVQGAPTLTTTVASSQGYLQAAMVGRILTHAIGSLGYVSYHHMDGRYLMPLPFLAERAGLGQIGRAGILVTKEYGLRIRLGAVTTDLPLSADEPLDFGLQRFCGRCGRCATACPGKAIAAGEPGGFRGEQRWQTSVEQCYQTWMQFGSDCGICLKVCPFSQQDPEAALRPIAPH